MASIIKRYAKAEQELQVANHNQDLYEPRRVSIEDRLREAVDRQKNLGLVVPVAQQ